MPSTSLTSLDDLPKLELTFIKSNHSDYQPKTSGRKRLTNFSTLPNDVKDALKDFEKSVQQLGSQLSILEALSGGAGATDEFHVSQDITSFCKLTERVREISSATLSSSEASLYRSYIVVSIQQDVARQVYESKLIVNPLLLKLYLEYTAMGPLPLHLHRKYKLVESNMKRIKKFISTANKLLRDKEAAAQEAATKSTEEPDADAILTAIELQFTTIQKKIGVLEREIADLERLKKERSPTKFTSKHRNNICYQLHQLNLKSDLEDEQPVVRSEEIEQDTAEYDDCDVSLNASALLEESVALNTSNLSQGSPLVDRSTGGIGGALHYGSLSIDESELLLRSRALQSDISDVPVATPSGSSRRLRPRRGFNNASYWHKVKLDVLKDKRPSFSLRSFEAFFDQDDPSPAVSTDVIVGEMPSRIPSSWRNKVQLLNHSTVSSLPLRVTDESLGDWRHVKPCVLPPHSSVSSFNISSDSKPGVSPLLEALKVIDAYTTADTKKSVGVVTAATATAASSKPSTNPFATTSVPSADSGAVNLLSARSSRATRAVESSSSGAPAAAAPAVDGNLVAIRSTYKRSDSVNSEDAPNSFNAKLSTPQTTTSTSSSSSSSSSSSTAVSSGDSKRANRTGSFGLGERTASGDEEGIASVDKSLGTIKGTNMLDITKKGSPSGGSGVKTFSLVTPTSVPAAAPTMAVVADVDMNVAQITEAIHAIYQQHNPSKVDEIPKLLAKYQNRELEMLNKVRAKYNVPGNSARVTVTTSGAAGAGGIAGGLTVNTDLNNAPLEKLTAPDSSPRLTNTRSSSVFDLSGLTTPTGGGSGKNPFARESPKSLAASSGAAPKNLFGANASPVHQAQASLTTTGFGAGNVGGSLFTNKAATNPFGGSTSGTTTPFGVNAASATSATPGSGSLFSGSAGGGFQSPFTQQANNPLGASAAAAPAIGGHSTPISLQEVQARVTAIYQQHNPMKISEIPHLMEKYRGKELQLIANLEKKYNVAPAAAATVAPAGSGFGLGQLGQGSLFNRSASVAGTGSPFGATAATTSTPPTGGSLFQNRGSAGVGGTVSPFGQQQHQQHNPTPFGVAGQPVQTSPFGQTAQPTNLNTLFGSSGVMGTQSPFNKTPLGSSTSLNPLGIAGSSGSGLFGNAAGGGINATAAATPFGSGFNSHMSSGSSSSGTSSLFSGGSTSNTSSLFNRSPQTQTPFGQPQMMQMHQQQQQMGTPSSLQEVQARVTAIYQQYNPMKISEIPSLMEKYRGRELQLIANLEKKYNVQPGAAGFGAGGGGGGGLQQSPFGQQQPQQQSLFGGAAAAAQGGMSLFGGSPGMQQQQQGSLFGGQQQQSPFGGASLMGAAGQPQQSPFGGSSGFGMTSTFGATPPQQTPFGGGGGGGANTFGTASPQQPGSLFGSGNRGSTAAGALSLFNRSPLQQQQQQQQATPFGNASRTTSGFGTPTPFGNAAVGGAGAGNSLFGNRTAATTGFGSTGAVGWGNAR